MRHYMKALSNRVLLLLFLIPFIYGCAETDPKDEGTDSSTTIQGCITDTSGKPLEGIVVSNGYTCAATGADGNYVIPNHADAYYIYYSLPSAYQVETNKLTGLPGFYTKLRPNVTNYDFVLTPLSAPEPQFDLYCIGDPQVNDMSHVNRFREETVNDIKSYSQKTTTPKYAIALGDLVNNKWELIPNMVSSMQESKVGMFVFQTIGNHDHDFKAETDLLAQRTYESYCGPVNYSFNRGDAHIVSMDNVIHGCASAEAYEGGFLDWQYQWLQEDLSYVSKEKMVILCVHIPFRQGAKSGGNSMNTDKYYNEVLELLATYKSATIMSAHTHSNINYIHRVNSKGIYEHITGTTCGAWWRSTVCTEGTPNGYGIYHISEPAITSWIYKPVQYDDSFQIRIYRGTDKFMGGKSPFTFSKNAQGQIVANIWNADPEWKVSVYENDQFSGSMTPYTDHDAWAVAYHVGELGGSSSYNSQSGHLYHYLLKDPLASVKIEAIDRFGNKYYQTQFTEPDSTPKSY